MYIWLRDQGANDELARNNHERVRRAPVARFERICISISISIFIYIYICLRTFDHASLTRSDFGPTTSSRATTTSGCALHPTPYTLNP